jgi:uncharacterized membrane protein
MDSKTKIWIKSMEICSKYWGCHQLPERSFFYKEYQFPVCSRCTGIILGEIIYLCFFKFSFKITKGISFLLMLPLMIDGTVQYTTKYISNNRRRLITGWLYGIGFVSLMKNMIYKY